MYLKKIYKRKKSNDKGFTLVELVIVVAILAVLVGMLAPQYTKYVEKSRRAADMSNMDKIIKSIQTAAVDPDYYSMINPYKWGDGSSYYEIKISKKGTDIGKKDKINAQAQTIIREKALKMTDAMTEYYGKDWSSLTMKSNKWGKYEGQAWKDGRLKNETECIFADVKISSDGKVSVLKYGPPAFAEAMGRRS